MVKCCLFMIGFVCFWIGLFMIIIGSSIARSTGRLSPVLLIGFVLLSFSIMCFYFSGKLERDEKIRKAEKARKKEEIKVQNAQTVKMEKKKEIASKEKEQKKKVDTKPSYCAYCGAEMKPDQLHCANCGTARK